MRKPVDLWRRTTRMVNQLSGQERRLVARALVIGAIVWLIVFTLKEAVHWLFHTVIATVEAGPTPLLILLPLAAGALIVSIMVHFRGRVLYYHDAHGHVHELLDVEGDGLERAISLFFSSEEVLEHTLTGQVGVEARWELPTFSLAWRKFLATLATLGSGGSGGLEASVALIGESVAAGLFKPRHLVNRAQRRAPWVSRLWSWWSSSDPDELQTAQLAGIAAAVSTLLGAPFAAAFFATEVMYRRRPIVERLVFALVASLTAFFLNNIFSGEHMFELEHRILPPSSLGYYLVLVLMAATISIFSIFFTRLRGRVERFFHNRFPVPWQRHLLGALMTGIVALLIYAMLPILERFEGPLPVAPVPFFPLELALGPGETVINAALAGEIAAGVALLVLLAKLATTLLTIGSGGSAGLLIPSLFFGTMIATAFTSLFGLADPMMLIAPAMTASLVSIVNVPLAAILLVIEIFGAAYLVPSLVVLVVSLLLAQEVSIYRTQRETYDARQIVPGYSVRRVALPETWAGKTLVDLDVRRRFALNVIGVIGRQDESDTLAIRFEPPSTAALEAGEVLVVLGADDNLDAFEAALATDLAERLPAADETP